MLEDRRLLAGDISWTNLATELHGSLASVQSNLTTAINYAPVMPIVGDQLAGNSAIGQLVSANGDRVVGVFQGLPGIISQQYPGSPPTTTQLVDLVKQQLVSVAGDLTADHQITTSDVVVTPNVGGGSAWRFELLVHQDLTPAAAHPQFKAALGNYLTVDGSGSGNLNVDLNVGIDYLLQFTFDTANNTLALEPTSLSGQFPGNPQLANASLAVEITAAPSAGFSASGRVAGLLHITATDNGSHLTGTFAATIGSTGQVTGSLTATSHLGLHLIMDFGSGSLPFNPQMTADFQYDWMQQNPVVLVSGMLPESFGVLEDVKFESITLVGSSLFGSGGFVSNIVQKVQAFTKPIQPLIDFISFQVPGLSDLGLDVSVKSFLEEANPDSAAAIEATINAIDAINHINLSALTGDFVLGTLELGSLDTLRQLQNPNWTAGASQLNTISLPGQLAPLDFPIITDPAHSAVQLLLGGDATLFSFAQGFSADFNLPDIPLFGIPPFLGFFLRPKAAFNLSFSFGYDTAGLRAAVSDADASHLQAHILDGFYIDNTKTHVTDSNGNDYDHYATSVNIIGELDLVARAVILEVSGGLAAQVNLHVDPNLNDGQQRVRLSALDQAISEGQIPFAASGSIYVTADIAVVIPTFWGNIVLAHVNLGHLTIVDFGADGHPAPEDDGNTIFVQKTDAARKVYVRMATLSTPTADDPRAFTKAILVEYPDLKEYYPVAKYTHDANGVLLPPEHIRDYNLIATKQAYHVVIDVNLQAHYVPYDETGDQTIIVEDLTWDGQLAPVDAVLIGGAGNDTLEYQGAGKAVLIGAGGDDILQSTNPNAASVAEFGDRIAANQTAYYATGWPTEVQNRIDAQIETDGEAPLVHAPGAPGDFMSGAGSHVVLAGGSGANLLEGGTSTTFLGGSGTNEYKVSLKLSANNPTEGHILVGQSAHNTVIFERTDVPNNDDDSVVLRALGGNLFVTGKQTDIVVDHTDTVSFTLNGGTLDIGDLSSLGTVHLLANLLPSRTTVTHVLMDTPLTPQAYPIFLLEHSFAQLDSDGNLIFDAHGNLAQYYDLDVLQGGSADLPGANLEMVGLAQSDDLQLKLHGGQVKIGNLDGAAIGRVVIDGTARAANSNFVDDIQIDLPDGNDSMFPDVGGSTTVLMADAMPPYRVQILGNQVQDITRFTQTVLIANGVNPLEGKLVTLDASQLLGDLQVNTIENVLLTAVNPHLDVSIEGSNNFPTSGEATHVTIGNGLLGNIQSLVHVSSAELTIDNRNAQGAPSVLNAYSGSSRLILTDTVFSGWPGPFSVVHAPMVTYDNLQGPLTVYMGQEDDISLDGTPPGISRIAINSNWFSYRDAVYSANWSVPIDIAGDFGIYLGQRLNPLTGAVERIQHLGGLAIPVTYYAAGLPAVDVVLDGELDPPNANYILDGDTKLHVVNQEMGLSVTINGFRSQDQLHVLMPGGTVQADLTETGPGTISIDGSARLAGTNAAAENNIVVGSRGANITLDPSGANNSVLQAFNTLYVLGSMPQDNLTLNVPTQTNVTNTVTIDASQLQGTLHVNSVNPLPQLLSPFGLTTVNLAAVNPLLAVFIVGTDPFSGGSTYAVAQTTVKVGAGRLARIEGNVTVGKVVLTMDDSAATVPSDMTITATDASGWITTDQVPAPRLLYSNLYRDLTINAGAGDRFELDHTPQTLDHIVLNNATSTQDQIYSTNWTAPIIANGNWSIFLGSFLHPDGTVDRVKNLVGLAIPVTLNFSGAPTGHVVLDGDLDPAGAQYVIDGSSNLHIVNQTVGLNVTINGFRAQDDAYIYLPGGTVAADLRHTGSGILYFDGKSRLAGNHPTAPNSVSAQVRAGDISLDPVSANDSVLQAFNTLFVLGSMPQDSLQVIASTSFHVTPSQQGFPRTSVGVYTGYFGTYNVVNQPADFYTVLSWPFQPIVNTDSNEPGILVGAAPPAGVNYRDTTLLYRYSGSDPQGLPDVLVPVRIYPLASDPVTIDNNATFDASQLRGTFSFQTAQPDYSTAETLVAGFGARSALPVETFGQTSVVLSKVNPQLSVSITGTTPITGADYDNLNSSLSFGGGSVIDYVGTQVTIGSGALADIQGNVSVHQAWLKEVNDRQGTAANNFTLSAGALTSWATPAGTHPTLTFDSLQGDLAVGGSAVDQFDVEGTPDSAPRVTIQNFSTSGPASGVYVMGKSVMPLFVTGNFALSVGRRLNADGTVTNVGQVAGVYDYHNRFNPYDASLSGIFIQQHLFENFQMLDPSGAVIVPEVTYETYVGNDTFRAQQPLPVFFQNTLSGQSTLVFDASHDVLNQGHWGTLSFNPSANYIGIAANANYPAQADLRFFQGDVIYGTNIETFFYGPQLIGSPGFQNKPGPAVLIDNPLTSPVHYIGSAHNSFDAEEVLIGAARGPVSVAGAGPGTLVELNPLFSLPIGAATSVFTSEVSYHLLGLPGWTSGNAAGFSLLDTIHADVTVSGASLRIVGDIPLPIGVDPPSSTPEVHLNGNQITGIAGATVHFSGLLDLTFNSFFTNWGSSLDMEVPQLPGLSILLPGHGTAPTIVDETPSGISTLIGSVLSASDAAVTAGPISVLQATGSLVLGQFFGSYTSPWPVAVGQPSGSLTWSDGLSVPSLSLGNGGSLQNIHGSVLVLGDSHNNSPLVTNIDGRADPARAAVSFVAQSYSPPPPGIISARSIVFGTFFEELHGFTPGTIYFGSYFALPRNLNVYGSAGSSYNVAAAPPTMRLFAGASSSVVNSSAPINIIGATTVQLLLGSFSPIVGYSGPPQVVVSEDPAHPQPIDLRVDRTPLGVFPSTPSGTLHLENAGGGLMSLRLHDDSFAIPDYWQVVYRGADARLAVNYGPVIVSDTGAAGTVINAGAQATDVYGTTGPLTINPSGSFFAGVGVRLGQAGNMQAILGEVDILSNAAPLSYTFVSLNDSADASRRTIHLATDVNGNSLISGMAPGLIKLVGAQFSPTLAGGLGGSTFRIDTESSPFFSITGGSAADLLAGPDLPNLWQIGTNAVYLNANGFAQNIASVLGGVDSDTFNIFAGPLSGNLDGGPGIDTLSYSNYADWHGVPFDLAHGIAPLVGGTTSNVEIVPLEMATGDQTNYAGAPIPAVQIGVLGGLGVFTYTASGLPAGLTLDSHTGLITGTIPESAGNGSRYAIHVIASDGYNSTAGDFQWTVLSGISLTNPGNRNSTIGDQVSLTIQVTSIYGQPLTLSAQSLPPGLAIDAQTGLISGTIPGGADAGSPYNVVVAATDGAHTGSVAFRWNVLPVDHSTLEAISWADPSLGSPLPNNAAQLESASTVVSADGRYVAFYSYASNLVPGDTNNNYDVFVRDRETGTTALVSGGISGPGNGSAFDPSVSADGRYVAFYSSSSNLVPGGSNGNYQVFVRDLQTGTTTLVSIGPNGQGNNTSASPTISANGRYITFYSSSNNLTPEGGNGFYQTYVRDLQTGTTTLVSTGSNGEGNGQSYYPSAISADGRYVAFASTSTNLAAGGTSGVWQVFLRDQQAGTTRLVSTGVGGPANRSCYDVSISGDGSRIAFDSGANDLVAGTASFISNVYVSDWQGGVIALVSVDSAGQFGNGYSADPSISASGRYVAFDSGAANLVAEDTNGYQDVFLHDLQTGLTKRISVGSALEGDNDSYYPSISADGRAVAFNSSADNLVAGFNVQNYEIYLYINPDIADNADPLSVGNTSDSGPGSLRQAILYVNSLGGSSHTITFALPAGSQTINLLTPLPAVTSPLVVALDASQNVKIQSPPGNVWANSSSMTQTGPGTLTFTAGIEGPGTLTVGEGSSLTTGHIVQAALVIGGTAGAPALVTITASDVSGNPSVPSIATPASAATDTASNNPQLLAPASADHSAVALSSTSTMTAANTTSSAPDSSPIRNAGALTSHGSFARDLGTERSPLDPARPITRQASVAIVTAPTSMNPAVEESDWSLSRYAVGRSSPADQAIVRGRQVAAALAGALLRRDEIAAAFDEADIQKWLGSAGPFRRSAPDVEINVFSDDLLEAIGQRWRN